MLRKFFVVVVEGIFIIYLCYNRYIPASRFTQIIHPFHVFFFLSGIKPRKKSPAVQQTKYYRIGKCKTKIFISHISQNNANESSEKPK